MKGTNKPSNPDRKRAAGYSETERPGEERIKALQDKVATYFDKKDLSHEDKKRAKEFKERGENWIMPENRPKKKKVSEDTYINVACLIVETISDKDLEHYKGRPSRKKVKKKATLPAGLEAAAILGKNLSIRKPRKPSGGTRASKKTQAAINRAKAKAKAEAEAETEAYRRGGRGK